MSGLEHIFAYLSDTKVVSPDDFKDNENIKLSGRILNAMTSLPMQICRNNVNGEIEWEVKPVRGNSALYSSHYFLQQHTEWEEHLIAWTGELVDKVDSDEDIHDDPLYISDKTKGDLEQEIRRANRSENVHPVWLLRKDQSRWRTYAENVLWPVFHYIQGQPSDGKAENEYWHDYVRFNEAYFNKIKQIYKPGDIIWIHDYYLLLLPQLLRMEFPKAYIGFYNHGPFPSSEYFRCLSKRTQLLDGILGSDQVGFQSESFKNHFLSCCSRILGSDVTETTVTAYGSTIRAETLPIGIDTRKIENDAFSTKSTIEEKYQALNEAYDGMKVIIGRDRLDSVRGVVQKLQAFDMFLQMYPEWRGKAVLIQVSSPSYTHSKRMEKKVTELVNEINGTYGTLNYSPVLHYQMMIDRDEYLALLRIADAALITSVRDGMNTTSLEYVVCQKYNHSPLILSEFTGTASVLHEAILVNPWDSVGIARTLNNCLLMSQKDKEELENKLYKQVTSNTIQNWTSAYLTRLINHVKHSHQTHYTPALNRPLLLNNFLKAERRLFLFDYDGTLTPIVRDPAAAIPSERLNEVLDTLTADSRNQIWIISGRDQVFLEKWFGNKKVGLSAEHGCFMKDVGSENWVNLSAKYDMSWQVKVEEVFQYYTERTPGTNIERKKVALTWHYRRADPELGQYQAERCMAQLKETVAKEYDVEVMAGKANIEVRPKFVNKGEIVKRLVLNPHGTKQNVDGDPINTNVDFGTLPNFVLCLGDDLTDEDMFRSLKQIESKWNSEELPKSEFGTYGVYPVAVGPANKKTIATAHLNEPSQVLETLGLLAGKVSLFESAGSVDLDDRGHVQNSETSERSKSAKKAALKKHQY
jgi:trehalose 6-phosphate synthase/phosphatase